MDSNKRWVDLAGSCGHFELFFVLVVCLFLKNIHKPIHIKPALILSFRTSSATPYQCLFQKERSGLFVKNFELLILFLKA